MREILFKAKRIDNGEWVHGFYALIGIKEVIIQNKSEKYYCTDKGKNSSGNKILEIDPSTICQYTGLTDKNGQKICENDVVEIPQENGKFIIEWNETEAKWQMNNYAEEFIVDFDNYWSYNTEVIGNIFDNKELLKAEE